MTKKDLRFPVIKYSDVPFYEITAPMRFYFPICDENPYAAYLLDYCFSLRAISLSVYQQKLDQEEMRLDGMSPEDRETEVERMWRDSLNKEEMRQTRVYEGEAFLNDEDDAKEGANGFFDLNLGEKQTLYALRGETPLEHLRQHFEEAYRLLKKKGFLVSAGGREQLAWWAVDGALEACYPDLYKQQEHEAEQKRKRESTKVQHHVNSAKRLGLPATLTLPEWIETLSYFEWKCAYCRNAPYTVLEHVQPIIAGGGTTAFFSRVHSLPQYLPPRVSCILCF